MYPVSNNYKIQIKKTHRVEHVRGTIGGVAFTDDNVISLNYSNRCSDKSDVTIGSAYIGQITATFYGLAIERGSWRGKSVVLEYGLEFDDHSVEWLPIGTFKIIQADWTDTSISIKANDAVGDLDKQIGTTQTSGYIYDLLYLACVNCNLQFARTRAQIEALPNGQDVFGLYPDNDIKTWRDYCSWVAQLVGGYITAARDGRLTVRSWNESTAVDTLTTDDRNLGSVFSDYTTLYDGVSVVNIADKSTRYSSAGTGDGAVINLGSNPFLQYGTDETIRDQLYEIAEVANGIQYTPFNIAVVSDPSYDLGDLIECSGGVAGEDTLTCCIMEIDWTFKAVTELQGYGSDPNLSSAKSKTDKALSGLLAQTKENEMIIHTFENAAEIELEENVETTILQIRFATVTPKIINLWHEIDLDVSITDQDGIVTCTAYYYLNDELIAYTPVTTWDNDGLHLLHLLYFLQNLVGGARYDWTVKLKMSGGTATINVGNIHASLYGQGLVAVEAWDGLVECDDEYTPIALDGEFLYDLSDSAVVAMQTPIAATASDNYSPIALDGKFTYNFAESVTVNFLSPRMTRITEDGTVRATESGDIRITEGGE